ncbi:uncharacterized protein LOC129348619 [Amphiprion ocellaris]|uniref:uncharacterized protein LOC129348619 n=1 Tax=Amphiprion ocellaris TaxID=80972 RepID=UPI002410F14B|nr:uncharacterized protein LOC129348619 [Amphiprion ocellaris]
MQICQLTTNIPNQKSDKSDDLQISSVYCSTTASIAKFVLLDGSVEQNDEGNIEVGENGGKDDLKQENNIEDEKRHTEQEEDGKPMAKTSQTDIREDCEGSGKDAEETNNPETETKDRGDTDEVNEGGQTSETAETLIASQTTADRTTEQSYKLQVNDFMGDKSGLSVGETSNFSQHLSQNMIEKVSSHEIRKDGHSLCLDEHQSDNQEPNSIIQEVSGLLNQSSSSEMNAAPLPGRSDVIQELEMSRERTETCILTDNTTDTKQEDEMSDTCVRKMAELHPQSQETSKQEESVVNDDKNGDYEGQSNIDKHEDKACKTRQTPKDADVDITMTAVDLDSGSCQDHVKSNKTEDSGDVKTTKSEKDQASGSSKHHDHHLFRETLFDDSFPTTKTYRPLFDWSKTKSDVLQQSVQGSSFSSEPNLTDPDGFLRHPSCTIPAFLKSKHSKGPLVIMRALDLLNASSVSGTSASSPRKRRQDGWKATEGMYRQTTADMDGRVPTSCSKRSSSEFLRTPTSPCGHEL